MRRKTKTATQPAESAIAEETELQATLREVREFMDDPLALIRRAAELLRRGEGGAPA